ncbi:MAG TPA: glycosyltransferase [Thermoflexales bacterium]|nr:glycosyltransferase [Thermoflexales bacterium]HQZ21266.1 glycosyltransferase [Thermoflexales bacterium]
MPICITGMHRSGTSMIARMLNICGVYLGKPDELMPPAADNPDGFWEHLGFRQLNDDILALNGAAWDFPPNPGLPINSDPDINSRATKLVKNFSSWQIWGWKDPRVSLTLPLWNNLAPTTRYVICLRHPLAVSKSLSQRGSSSLLFGLQLWEKYFTAILMNTDARQRVVVDYDALIEDPVRQLSRMLQKLGVETSESKFDQAINSVKPLSRHHLSDASYTLSPYIHQIYTALLDESKDAYLSETSLKFPQNLHSGDVIEHLQTSLAAQVASAALSEEKYLASEKARVQLDRDFQDKILHLSELERSLEDMTSQRDQGIKQLRIYENQIQILVAEKKDLQALQQADESNLALYKENLIATAQSLRDANLKREDLQTSAALAAQKLEHALEEALKEKDKLALLVDGLQKELDQRAVENKELRERLETQIADLKENIEQRAIENQELRERLAEAIGATSSRSEFIEALKAQMLDIAHDGEIKQAELRTELGARQATLNALNQTAIMRLGRKYWAWRARVDGKGALAGTREHYLVRAMDGKPAQTARPAPPDQSKSPDQPLSLTPAQRNGLAHILRLRQINASVDEAVSALSASLSMDRRTAFAAALDKIDNRAQNKPMVRQAIDLPPVPSSKQNSRQRILFITGEFPNYIHGGGGRFADFIYALGKQHDIYLFTWYHASEDADMLAQLRPVCKNITTLSSREFETVSPDAVFNLIDRQPVDVAHYAWPRALRLYDQRLAKKHMFTHVESVALRSMIELEQMSVGAPAWAAALARFASDTATEIHDTAPMDARIVVTPSDGEFLAALDGGDNYFVIPTTINFDEFELPEVQPHPRSMTFTGNFKHYPNEDGAHWFFRHVFPRVQFAVPDARVYIVGASPSESVLAYNDEKNIFVTGTVADVRPYIQNSSFCIAPLVNGAGIRGKVNQYAALRRVCVGTSIAAKDLPYQQGKEVFIADDPAEFANRIIELLSSPSLARTMGQNAQDVAKSSYDLSVAVEGLNRLHEFV